MNGACALVESARSVATLVIECDADSRVREAVSDLARVIARMSGAALPVVEDGARLPDGLQVHIGETAFVMESGFRPESITLNGYRIAVSPETERIAIVGGGPIGVSHGLYDLLTNELGVVWGMADPLFEDVPERSTVAVGPIDRTVRPPFGFRVFVGTDQPWCRRNRLDEPDRALPFYGHSHNMHNILPPDKYRNHPEYFALVGGARRIPDGHFGPQPCMTHPEVIRIGIDATRRFFADNPQATTFSLCPNDTKEFCECPNCLSLDGERPHFRNRNIASDSYFHFVNEVAKGVLESHPGKFVSAYAYWATELPPKRIAKLSRNVVVYFTTDASQYHDPEYERQDRETLRRWLQIAEHVAIYDYYGLGWFLPRYYPTNAARALKHLHASGVAGFYCEAWPYWAHTGPQLYLASRLLWNTSLDPNAVLDEWFERMFREAAPRMKAFYGFLEEHWMTRKRSGKWFEGFDWIFEQFAFWPREVRDEAWNLLEAAGAAARADIVRARIDYVRRGHRAGYLLPMATERALALNPDSPTLEADVRGVSVAFDEALRQYRTHVKTDLTYGNHYYVGTTYGEERNFVWWRAYLGDLVESVLNGKPDLRSRLVREDATLAWFLRARKEADADIEMRIGWAHDEFGRKV